MMSKSTTSGRWSDANRARGKSGVCTLVTRMLGLRNVASMRIEDNDTAGVAPDGSFGPPGRPDWIGRTLIDADGHRWMELDLAKLAAGIAFLMVGR